MAHIDQVQTDWTGSGLSAIANKPSVFTPTTNAPQWIKIATKIFTDFSSAGLVNTIASGYLLPANGIITGCQVMPTVAFSGTAIASYTVSVGVGSGAGIAKYGIATNVFTGFSLAAPNLLGGIESTSTTTSITLTATSSVGLLNAGSAGSVNIWILIAILP